MKLESTACAYKDQLSVVAVLCDEFELSGIELERKVHLQKAKNSQFDSMLRSMNSISQTTAVLTESLSAAISSAKKKTRKRQRPKSTPNRRERRKSLQSTTANENET